jgi:hypothetical protein
MNEVAAAVFGLDAARCAAAGAGGLMRPGMNKPAWAFARKSY